MPHLTSGIEATPKRSNPRSPLRFTPLWSATMASPSRMWTSRSVAAEPVTARSMKRSITSRRPSSMTGVGSAKWMPLVVFAFPMMRL